VLRFGGVMMFCAAIAIWRVKQDRPAVLQTA
jgi:hypothetical protein